MSPHLHLQIAGVLLLALSAAHGFFWRYFGWGEELAGLSTLTRQVFGVHCFFVALMLAMFGALSLFAADALLAPELLARAVLSGMLVFWLCRLACQWFVYDRAIWRARPLYKAMHVVFSALWTYLAFTYALALLFRATLSSLVARHM
jgi:hypothetical protein